MGKCFYTPRSKVLLLHLSWAHEGGGFGGRGKAVYLSSSSLAAFSVHVNAYVKKGAEAEAGEKTPLPARTYGRSEQSPGQALSFV